jgi:hypothetical protein
MITFLEWMIAVFIGLKIGKAEVDFCTIDYLTEIEKQRAINKFGLLYLFINHADNYVFEWLKK